MQREVREISSRGEWLEWRRGDATASSIAALFELHPYVSRQQLADRMRGAEAGTSLPPDNPAMRRGRLMEPGIAVAVAEACPHWTLIKANTYHRLPELRLGASPDYWIESTVPAEAAKGKGVLEAKSCAPQVWERWRGQPHLAYLLQVQAQLMCTGCEWAYLAVMVTSPSLPLHLFAVQPHAAAQERIMRAAAQFHRDLETGALGPAAEAAGLAEALDDGSSIDLSGDNELPGLLDERELLRRQVHAEEQRIEEISERVKEKIGTAARAWLPGWALSYETHHRKAVTLAAKDIRSLRIRRSREEEEHAE